MNKWWDEGSQARWQNKAADTNPYPIASERWLDWADGWKDTDEHIRARQRAEGTR